MTSLQERITNDWKEALKAGATERRDTLSGLRAAIKNQEIETRATLSDDAVQVVVNKEAKRRREAITEYQKAGRDDLAGGAGRDVFHFESGFGRDVVLDFRAGEDLMEIEKGINGTGITEISQLASHISADKTGAVITLGGDQIKLVGVSAEDLIGRMKRGAYLVNTARGKICDRDAVARACESGQLAGYAGDVWFPQPAPRDHPWRTMPNHGMTPHTSGTSLSAQTRYAAGTREILECWLEGKPIREEYLIVDGGLTLFPSFETSWSSE